MEEIENESAYEETENNALDGRKWTHPFFQISRHSYERIGRYLQKQDLVAENLETNMSKVSPFSNYDAWEIVTHYF